jgi:hypothetical protein
VSEATVIESTSFAIEVIYEKKEEIMNERVAPAFMNRAVELNFLSNELKNEAARVRKIGPHLIIVALTYNRSLSLTSIPLSITTTIDLSKYFSCFVFVFVFVVVVVVVFFFFFFFFFFFCIYSLGEAIASSAKLCCFISSHTAFFKPSVFLTNLHL